MGTSKEQIKAWFEDHRPTYTHMLVVCDCFDYEDYPVYVKESEDLEDKVNEFNKNMQKVMEVYSYSIPIEAQLQEPHSWHVE